MIAINGTSNTRVGHTQINQDRNKDIGDIDKSYRAGVVFSLPVGSSGDSISN